MLAEQAGTSYLREPSGFQPSEETLGNMLRADALRVAASRQISQNGVWVDAPVQAATVQKLEDVILTKARDLRRQALPSGIN